MKRNLDWTPLCEYADPNLDWEIEGFAQFNVYNGLMHPLAEAAVSGSPANAAYSYLALDHLSSTRAVYNQAKTATASLEFYPYGEPLTATGALPDARFTAKPYDPETGLYYFPYRYYSPSASRWISRDPIGLYGGLNTYTYVSGKSKRFFDPLGLAPMGPYLDSDGNPYNPTTVIADCIDLALEIADEATGATTSIRHCVAVCELRRCGVPGFIAQAVNIFIEIVRPVDDWWEDIIAGREGMKCDTRDCIGECRNMGW